MVYMNYGIISKKLYNLNYCNLSAFKCDKDIIILVLLPHWSNTLKVLLKTEQKLQVSKYINGFSALKQQLKKI